MTAQLFRRAIWSAPRGRRQHRNQRGCLLRREVASALSEPEPRRRWEAAQCASERDEVQIRLEHLRVIELPRELTGAPDLPELAEQRARMRLRDAGKLHVQRRRSRNDVSAHGRRPRRPNTRQPIDARVPVESSVFRDDHRSRDPGRHLLEREVDPALAVLRRHHPQRSPVLRHHSLRLREPVKEVHRVRVPPVPDQLANEEHDEQHHTTPCAYDPAHEPRSRPPDAPPPRHHPPRPAPADSVVGRGGQVRHGIDVDIAHCVTSTVPPPPTRTRRPGS